MNKKLYLMLLMALFLPLALLSQEFDHLTYFTQTTTDDFKHGTPYFVDIAGDSVSLQYRMASVAEWASTTNMPQTLKQHQVVTWRDWAYLVGGSSNGTNAVNTVYRATQQTNGISGWSGLNAMPVALKDMAVVATQTRLIVMGGRNDNGVSDKIYYAPFNNDGSIGAWTESTVSLPNPTYGLRAVLAMGNIYLLGGTAVIDSVETVTNNTYFLKVNADGDIASIAEATSLPEARFGHAVVFYDSKIYVTGGCNSNATAKNTVWSSTISTSGTLGEWTVRTEMPEALYDHTSVFANGVLTVLGGHNGNIASDVFYYTSLDATALTWTQSDIFLPERKTQGASFAFGNKIFFCGGETLSGVINNNVSYMAVTTLNNPIRKTIFVSEPFYVGTAKTLKQLDYTIELGAGISCEILYRTASSNKVFSGWTSKSSNNPAVINQSKCYIQYMFRFSATNSCTQNISLQDVTLEVSGYSQLAGNLNDISTLTLEGSPYWVTQTISFTSGTHNIDPGVTIMFLNNTGMNIGQASVNFNGTQANPILLTAYDGANGTWNGVYFQDASDNGVSSVMNYTTIEKAGNGDNRSNLRLYYTNQPTMDHCTFRYSIKDGMYFQNSNPALTNCTVTQNTESNWSGISLYNSSPELTSCTISYNYYGLTLNNSAPSVTSCTISYNQQAGIYFYSSNFNATFNSVVSKYNLYGIYSCTPDHSFTFDSSSISLSSNSGADIAVAGGRIASDQTWNKYAGGYALLGNVEVYGGTPKLTVQSGTTIKGAQNCGLYIGNGGSQGGMLYAVGTTSQPITFTSLNGEIGGWNGVRFRDGSDYSSNSSMRYCVVEKGTTNLVCENTNQPSVKWCTFQDAQNEDVYLNNASISIEGSTIKNATKGLWVNSSAPTLVSVVFENHSECCVYHNNTCNPTYSDCTMKDSFVGVRYETCNRDMVNDDNITFENNMANIGVPGGRVEEDHTWDGNLYAVLGDLQVGRRYNWDPNHSRLTIMPGATLKFAEGKRMDVGGSWYYSSSSSTSYYGELYAEGTAEQPITFTSMNGEVGGWNGLVFNGQSDDFTGASSSLKHCIIEKGNDRNLHMGSTNQPGVIEDCVFRRSVSSCVWMDNSRNIIRNCSFEDNQNTALYYNNAHYVGVLENLTFSGNLYDGVTVNGGRIEEDRTWNAYTYFVLNDLQVGRRYNWDPNHSRLTIMPGATLKFAEGKRMDVGGSWYYSSSSSTSYYGELYAEGTAEQPITFTSMNGEVGGWNGLVFNGQSDDFSNPYSLLKYCVLEKGNEFNLYLAGTTLPYIENSIFQNSNGYGLRIGNEYNRTIKNSIFRNNASHGVYIVETTPFTLGGSPEYACSIYNNGSYAVYHDGGSNIEMTYNFWGEIGAKHIDDNLIYDKMDNSGKGRITFEPVSWFPVENFTHMQGNFTYNGIKPMGNREMNVIDDDNNVLVTVSTNSNGQFDFSNYQVSVYNTLDTDFGVDILAGVNATDALLVMRHFVQMDTLTGAQAATADVNLSGNINGTDAMLILRRAVDEQFPSGDYYYYSPNGITVEGSNCQYDLSFLCYGDVNGSYTPQNRDNSIELLTEGQLMADSYQEMELPVCLKTAAAVGAITLRFAYPEEYLEIEDVVLAATGESLLFTANEGELRTVWYSLQPLALAANDDLVILKVLTKDLSNIDEPVAFTLEAYSELADGSANVLEGVIIAMPEIVTETMGVSDNAADGLSLSVYPNPANDVCRLSYQLSETGRVTVSVYNIMGVKVMDVADVRQEEGRHELQLSTSNLAAGVYSCRITFEGESSWVKTTSIIIEK